MDPNEKRVKCVVRQRIDEKKQAFEEIMDRAGLSHTDVKIQLPAGLHMIASGAILTEGNGSPVFGFGDSLERGMTKAIELVAALELYLDQSEGMLSGKSE